MLFETPITTPTSMPAADTARIERLTMFAGDALDLADRRLDLELRDLVDELHADLIRLQEET